MLIGIFYYSYPYLFLNCSNRMIVKQINYLSYNVSNKYYNELGEVQSAEKDGVKCLL